MPDDIADDPLADLADLILNVGRLVRARTPDGAGTVPLTETERQVMRVVDLYPGAAPSEIARRARLQRTNVSTALRSLEDRGMVSRAATSGRGIAVTPTEYAAANLRTLRAAWSRELSGILGDDLEAVRDCNQLLGRLEQRLTSDHAGQDARQRSLRARTPAHRSPRDRPPRLTVAGDRTTIMTTVANSSRLTEGESVILINIKMQIRPEKVDQWLEVADAYARDVNSEDGCLFFQFARSLTDDNEFICIEGFKDADAGGAHVRQPYVKKFFEAAPDLVATQPQIIYIDTPHDGFGPMGEIQPR